MKPNVPMNPLNRSSKGSHSSPLLAAACNLRQFSLDRRRISPEHLPEAEQPHKAHFELMADLNGCNGRWRKERATEEWERQQRLKEIYEEKMRKKEERAKRKRA